ncbi:DUF2167 domain-containing protein [Longimicrobium sp.]|uniref:DUF2167 domain-containing protein n=1 Tax=Longimicrobium sp. TaxID=2029185 RepID=UPI002E322216|nr:DUF2167 domain-containing protein [Longimicrobium sp.]HEX6041502.1 DUF2167 domain-containing protein [Longimicrobium sp.]
MNIPFRSSAIALAALALALPARAQAPDASQQLFESIKWQDGPDTARIGTESQVVVPPNCRFTSQEGTHAFLQLTENPSSERDLALMLCSTGEGEDEDSWFVVFSFDDSGYVQDNDAGDLDADAILKSLRDGNEAANVERRSKGWTTLTLDRWVKAPFYDPRTNNLTWATEVTALGEGKSVNHSVRLLGRGGVMNADLITDPAQFEKALPAFDAIVASHSFLPGRRYSEWREGDKMAGYGLTALVAGGAVAAAAKTGLLGKLLKPIGVALVAFFAWLRSLFSRKKD